MNAIAPHMLKCNVCRPEDGDPFRAPNDSVGVILMTEHLRAEHKIEPLTDPGLTEGWVKPLPDIESWRDLPDS